MRDGFEERVRAVLLGLEPGEVVTYGEVATEAGYPGAARAVGNLLATSVGLPWWRVVRADGRLAASHPSEQARRLAAEGVFTESGRLVPNDRRRDVGKAAGRGRTRR